MTTNYSCKDECQESSLPCKNKTCKYFIEYDRDLNCSLIAIEENGPMTLDEVSKRLGLSLVRIKQIEDHQGQTLVSEGIDANYLDIINYAIFSKIKTLNTL